MFHVEQISALVALPGIILTAMAEVESAQNNVPTLAFPLSTDNITTQNECRSALLDLIFGWDESARKHFETALSADETCIFAHAGMCLVGGDTGPDSRAKLKEYIGSSSLLPQELFLVETMLKLSARDYAGACEDLCKRADQFRADKISAVWAIILLHSIDVAYHPETGEPSSFQQQALERISKLCKQYPDDALICYARAYVEQTAPRISSDALASALQAADVYSNHPMPQHLMGHLLSRIGHHQEAAAYFNKAALLSSQRGLSLHESPLWWKSRIYEATALWSAGNYGEALKLRKALNAAQVKEEQALSPVGILQRWECNTLPLRILVAEQKKLSQGNITAASQAATPHPAWKHFDAVILVRDCLRASLSARLKAQQGKWKEAQHSLNVSQEAFNRFQNSFERVTEQSAYLITPWKRMHEACCIAINLAKAEVYQNTQELWKDNAKAAQTIPHLLLPPVIPPAH